ncbi:MAG TPA: DUF4832 domain-containing protein [Herpetosiphonaceae bacterium]
MVDIKLQHVRRAWVRLGLLLAVALVLTSGSWAAAEYPLGAATSMISVTPTAIPLSDPEIVNPLRGFYRWYGVEGIPQPRPSYDHYLRYTWRELEPSKGQYDFSPIERELQAARAAGAKLAFRVMSINNFGAAVEVPEYLRQEAGGSYCSYGGKVVWVPAWDHPQFLERARALMQALGARYNGNPWLGYYDMGIYGHWGEWHTNGLCTPPATAATKRALVDIQLAAFPSSRVLMNSGGPEVDAFVYALGASPRVGVRVDSLCDPWFDQQFTAYPAKLAAMRDRWKTAPVVSEYLGGGRPNLAECDRQVQTWHIAAVAGGNFGAWSSYSADEQAQLITIGKRSGYRIQLNALSYPAVVTTGQRFSIDSQWSNVGVTPLYEQYAVTFQLHQQGTRALVWTGVSHLNLERLLPTTQPQPVSDPLMMSDAIPAGQYELNLVVRDPTWYRPPLTLANTGRDSVGRYPLGTITVSPGVPREKVYLPGLTR